MPKPPKVDYTPIIAEYQTGQYSVAFLAKKYKIKRATLAKYISVNQIRISNNLKEAITSIDKGLEALKVTKENAKSRPAASDTQRGGFAVPLKRVPADNSGVRPGTVCPGRPTWRGRSG